ASFSLNNDGTITAITPSWGTLPASPVNVVVTTPGGTSATSAATQFTVTPSGALPTVTALSSSSGSMAGGQLIPITGTNFTDVTGVSFVVGQVSVPAASFTVLSPTSIAVVTPSWPTLPASAADIVVTTTAGVSATSTADQFTFQALTPVVTALSTASGFSTG